MPSQAGVTPPRVRDGPYPWSVKARIRVANGHLSNQETARYLAEGLGEACRAVILAHLAEKNNHSEVARFCEEAALRRGGHGAVRLEITGREGTDWVEVAVAPGPLAEPRGPKQLTLWVAPGLVAGRVAFRRRGSPRSADAGCEHNRLAETED